MKKAIMVAFVDIISFLAILSEYSQSFLKMRSRLLNSAKFAG